MKKPFGRWVVTTDSPGSPKNGTTHGAPGPYLNRGNPDAAALARGIEQVHTVKLRPR